MLFDMVSIIMTNERERKEIQTIIENVLIHRDTDNYYFLSKLIEAALHKEGYGKK
jgi:CRISPR/Cas system-associated protein Csm6